MICQTICTFSLLNYRVGSITDSQLAVYLKVLPKDFIDRHEDATELSDSDSMDRVIKKISIKNELLSSGLSNLAVNFAYDKILALIQNA